MAKYQVETEKGSFTLNGSTATALASALLVKLNNQRANGYKINGSYGDNMFSVVLVDKDKKPFKEYYLKKVGKIQDKSTKFSTYSYFSGFLKDYIGNSPHKLEIEAQTPEQAKKKTLLFRFNQFQNKGLDCEYKGEYIVCKKGKEKGIITITRIEKKGDNKNLLFEDKSPLSFMDSFVFFIEFAGEKGRNTAAIQAQTESEAINKFKKTKYKNCKIIGIRKTGKAPVMGGEQKRPKIGDNKPQMRDFMDSVVRAFRDETFPPRTIVVGEFVREERPYKKLLKFSLSDYTSTDKIRRELKERISQSEYHDKGEPYRWHLNEVKIKRPDENKYRKI